MTTELLLLPAAPEDYLMLAAIAHDAFHPDKLVFGSGPSVYEHPEMLLPLLQSDDGALRKLVAEGVTVGFVITRPQTDTARWLGCLCIAPAWQGRGYGSLALQLVEQAYPNVVQWGLDTPAAKKENRRFYERAGYRVVGESWPMEGFCLLVFEKRL